MSWRWSGRIAKILQRASPVFVSTARLGVSSLTKCRQPVLNRRIILIGSCTNSLKAYSTGLPEHFKIVLPALSPTMQLGTIVRWTKSEGDRLSEGDLLAEIETDKATMGFETPEEGYLAKILVPAGAKDIPIGKLVCVIVSKQEDVAAFKGYVEDQSSSASPSVAPKSDNAKSEEAPSTKTDYPEHITVKLPSLSPTMEKGSLQKWQKAVGDQVREGDVLVQIETDKATMDFENTEEGYLAKILVASGSRDIPVGTLLCVIVREQKDIAAFASYTAQGSPPKTAPPPPSAKPAATAPASPSSAQQTSPTSSGSQPRRSVAGSKVPATPYARTLASEKGIDINLVRGSGVDGLVRAEDVQNYTGTSQPTGATATYTDIELSNVRQVIARRLVESKQTVPHYYLSTDLQMEQILKLRKELNILLEKDKVKLSVNDFIIKAAALACLKVPEANSSWQTTFIRQYEAVDVSVAVATSNGLITPIVFGAEKKGLTTISAEMGALAQRAREGKLQLHEFQGGTFTISNLGMYGISNFSAIINPPQACILAIGGAERQLAVDDTNDQGYRVTTMMSVTLSCDHRVVDGAVGAQWLSEFRKLLEQPYAMLL